MDGQNARQPRAPVHPRSRESPLAAMMAAAYKTTLLRQNGCGLSLPDVLPLQGLVLAGINPLWPDLNVVVAGLQERYRPRGVGLPVSKVPHTGGRMECVPWPHYQTRKQITRTAMSAATKRN